MSVARIVARIAKGYGAIMARIDDPRHCCGRQNRHANKFTYCESQHLLLQFTYCESGAMCCTSYPENPLTKQA